MSYVNAAVSGRFFDRRELNMNIMNLALRASKALYVLAMFVAFAAGLASLSGRVDATFLLIAGPAASMVCIFALVNIAILEIRRTAPAAPLTSAKSPQ